jgi:hypothetical protein
LLRYFSRSANTTVLTSCGCCAIMLFIFPPLAPASFDALGRPQYA